MKNLGKDKVYVEIYEGGDGRYSLAICDDSGGVRVAGGKVSGMDLAVRFEVSAEELIVAINQHTGV